MDDKVKSETLMRNRFAKDVVDGLSNDQKTLPCKYFYDTEGSRLFEEICLLDEYYITRAELSLIDAIKSDIAERIGKDATIIEPGAGAGIKIQKLLNALDTPNTYIPIDISQDFLDYSESKINEQFPRLDVQPIQADFTAPIDFEEAEATNNRVVFFPGSTIGNFSPAQATELLSNLAELASKDGSVIVGFDLKKPVKKIEAAYNDAKGVTAQFNKNILVRINRELDADIDIDSFEHEAIFNEQESRIEMHLKSKKSQTIEIENQTFKFGKSETIHTENSYKYSNDAFKSLAENAGLTSLASWTDRDSLVSMHYLKSMK